MTETQKDRRRRAWRVRDAVGAWMDDGGYVGACVCVGMEREVVEERVSRVKRAIYRVLEEDNPGKPTPCPDEPGRRHVVLRRVG